MQVGGVMLLDHELEALGPRLPDAALGLGRDIEVPLAVVTVQLGTAVSGGHGSGFPCFWGRGDAASRIFWSAAARRAVGDEKSPVRWLIVGIVDEEVM